jgi:NhaP-type Na+/H+ or K+/H+ antiporter
MVPIILFLLLLFGYSLISRRLEQSVVTAPMLFTVAGMLMYPVMPLIRSAGVNASVVLRVAEIGLVLLLFTDASRTDLGVLRNIRNLPARLLSIGMLLTIVLGAVAAKIIFPSLSVWEAGILSAILAPTDAGLGQVIVTSTRVPMRVREALNVEAGLNDGLSVPFMLFFLAIAAAKVEGGPASLMQFIVEQLGYGVIVGLVVGLAGGWLLGLARRNGWAADSFLQVGVVAIPLIGMGVSELVEASMFIAAFVAGLAVQVGFKAASKHSVEFTEEWGQLFNLAVFFLFGMIVIMYWAEFDARCWLYAVLSLTVVRMLPVAVALAGTGLSRASVVFMGWFGPRGLASIVLGLVYLEQEMKFPGEETIRLVVILTVVMSIFAHGLSAKPGINLYARKVAALDPGAPELLKASS